MKKQNIIRWIGINTLLFCVFHEMSPALAMEPSEDDEKIKTTIPNKPNKKEELITFLKDIVEYELRPAIGKWFLEYKEEMDLDCPQVQSSLRSSLNNYLVKNVVTTSAALVYNLAYYGSDRERFAKPHLSLKINKFNIKFKDLVADLTSIRTTMTEEELFGKKGILVKIQPDIDISKVRKTARALGFMPFLVDSNESKEEESEEGEIWKYGFENLTKELTYYSNQPPERLHFMAYNLFMRKKETLNTLLQNIQKEAPHIKENFVNVIAKNIDDLRPYKNMNVTGTPLSQKKAGKLSSYMDQCTHVYTDDSTRDFGKLIHVSTIEEKWRAIVKNKKWVTGLYQNLLAIRKQYDDLFGQDLIYVKEGTKNLQSEQVPHLSMSDQTLELQKRFTLCMQEINPFLQSINRKPIEHNELASLQFAIEELDKVQQNIYSEYSFYFSEVPESSLPKFVDTDKEEHQLTNKAIIGVSFLHKTQLSQNGKVTLLDVGFRNLEDLKGTYSKVAYKIVNPLKDNPQAWFENWGEVDYIAYIEEDPTSHQKDRLALVYSGSNSAKDWVANFTLGQTEFLNVSVHEGIGKLFIKSIPYGHSFLMDRLKNYYKYHRKPKELRVITTGHSLGGALSSLAAYFYKTKQLSLFQQITGLDKDKISVKAFMFGSPAIVDSQSKEIMESELGKYNIYRIWNFGDPVVNLSNKFHIGISYPLYNIENLTFNLSDELFWGHHGVGRYGSYLRSLGQENLSSFHKKLTTFLSNYFKDSQLSQEEIKKYIEE